jgi:hypothetical protein
MKHQNRECCLITFYDTHRTQSDLRGRRVSHGRICRFCGPLLAKTFYLSGCFLVADLAVVLYFIYVIIVIVNNVAVFSGKLHAIQEFAGKGGTCESRKCPDNNQYLFSNIFSPC